jgi:hypothetical protein
MVSEQNIQKGATKYWGVDRKRVDRLRQKFIEAGHSELLKY